MKPTSSSLQKLTNLLRARTVIRALPPKTVIPVHVLAMIEQYHPPPAPTTTTLPRWQETVPAGRRPDLVGRSSSATSNDGAPHDGTRGGCRLVPPVRDDAHNAATAAAATTFSESSLSRTVIVRVSRSTAVPAIGNRVVI